MAQSETFISREMQHSTRLTDNQMGKLIRASLLRQWGLSILIAIFFHVLGFNLLQAQSYTPPLRERPYAIIPIKLLPLTPKTIERATISSPVPNSDLPKRLVPTAHALDVIPPSPQIVEDVATVINPTIEPTTLPTASHKETISRQAELPSNIIDRIATSEFQQEEKTTIPPRFKLKGFEVIRIDAQRQRTCEQQIRNTDLLRDKPAKPCLRLPAIMPSVAQHSGHCRIQYTVLPNGRVNNLEVTSCTDDIFREASLQSAKNWYYFPKVENGKRVESKLVKTKLTFNLRDQYGELIKQP